MFKYRTYECRFSFSELKMKTPHFKLEKQKNIDSYQLLIFIFAPCFLYLKKTDD